MRTSRTISLDALWRRARDGEPATPMAPDPDVAEAAYLARRADADHVIFTIVGPKFERWHEREFCDQNLLSLWRERDRAIMRTLIDGALSLGEPASAVTAGRSVDGVETLFDFGFWPLQSANGQTDQILGAVALHGARSCNPQRPVLAHRLIEARPASVAAPRRAPRAAALAMTLISAVHSSAI